ncbi:MAG: S41 family peptidase [Bacteroidota bacterium]
MKRPLLFIFLALPFFTLSQICTCKTNFDWVKATFEENDAGFSHVIEKKGAQAYKNHNVIFNEKAKHISDDLDCQKLLNQWLAFFRSGHLGVQKLNPQPTSDISEQDKDEEIIRRYGNSEKIMVDLQEFTDYLEAKEKIDYEGIWTSSLYKIGIKKINNIYMGFIIEADGVYWTKGQIKLKIHPDKASTYYMRDHSARTFADTELLGNNYIQIGFITLKRVTPQIDDDVKFERYFKMISSTYPYFETLDSTTNYLRIPSFRISNRKVIDSLVLANKALILKTPNLIIDLRNNGGGSDSSFSELLPILYTNPIRTVGMEYYSTPLNNTRMLDFINDPKYGFDDEGKQWAKASFKKLSKHLGQFVNVDSTRVEITTYDKVHQYPKNIGIIINENNGSTAEQFLLAAKQSKKVKLFGTTTSGVLDISNMYFTKSPCNDFELGYSLSRSLRIPEMTIDDKGIQPDHYLDNTIPKYEWTDFVRKILQE